MDLWLKITNTITVGSISGCVTLILVGIYGYYKIRRYLAEQHQAFLIYLNDLTANQTAHIEACIHKLPEHPENPAGVSPVPVIITDPASSPVPPIGTSLPDSTKVL